MCHGDIVDRISGINGYANICNNGKKEMMRIPSGFKSPREKYQVCKWEVKNDFQKRNKISFFFILQGAFFCHNDEVSKQASAAFPIRRVCVDGKVTVVNNVSGLSL